MRTAACMSFPPGPGIRVDSGFTAGDEVTHFYDPLLAKLIVHAENREIAIQRMQAALKEFVVHGVVTNTNFLQAALSHPDFQNGEVTTRWVETDFNWSPHAEPSFEFLIAASLHEITVPSSRSQVSGSNEVDPYSPWKNLNGFRIGGNHG